MRLAPRATLTHRAALLVTGAGEAIMDVAVFGATGRTGSRLVRQSVARGHTVVAIAREAARIESIPGVRVVSADAGDEAALAGALPGADVVLFALGHTKTSGEGVLTTGIRSTIAAMGETGVQRLITSSETLPPHGRSCGRRCCWRGADPVTTEPGSART